MSRWTLVRLELGNCSNFPKGSASRAYVLRVPLGEGGVIDEAAVAAWPARATVRRFWPNEPDRHGYLFRDGEGWAFSCKTSEDHDEGLYRLEAQSLLQREHVAITEPSGRRDEFCVVQASPDSVVGALPSSSPPSLASGSVKWSDAPP